MKNMLKKIIKFSEPQFLIKLPSLIKFRFNRFLHEKLIFRLASKESIFTSIWKNNYWGSGESLSGPGSTLVQTERLRHYMPLMFEEIGIKSVFDAPCGDMHWMQHVLKETDFSYIGGDIVNDLININNNKFSNYKVRFLKFDITKDKFPSADVWLCRSVFYHLSNRDIYYALEQFVSSDIKYILTTNCVTDSFHVNNDIVTGDWRSLNLMHPPFNFPREFLWAIDDYTPPHPPTTLTLWTKLQIEAILPPLREIYQQ